MAQSSTPSRRTVLRSAGTAGAAAAAAWTLSACGGSSDEDGAAAEPSTVATGPLAKAADVPVGGGVILPKQKVVVTQPTEGNFKAFSAICTHAGCVVAEVKDGSINCRCHGSQFAIDTGEPTKGPADRPLDSQAVSVQNGTVVKT